MNIVFAIGSRANFGSSRSVIERLRQEHNVSAIAYATAVLPRYGDVSREVEAICPTTRVYCHVEGETAETTSLTSSLVQSQVGGALDRTAPDLVFVVGDRFEVVPVAYACHLRGIKTAHIMAGEVSGTIDDKNRHAISQLADWHFCATEKSAERVRNMLGGPGRVFVTGCPRIDVAAEVTPNAGRAVTVYGKPIGGHCRAGGGAEIIYDRPPRTEHKPYVVVSFHPDVHTAAQSGDQMRAIIDGVRAAWDGDVHYFWPCADEGSSLIVEAVRESGVMDRWHTHRNMRDEDYYALLAGSRCAVGNSSSFIREGSYLGVPVVLVGDRQKGRERDESVIANPSITEETAIRTALALPRPEPNTLYGDGNAAERIAEALRAG